MATSTGQYTPVFFPGEPRSLTEKSGRPQSAGLQSRTLLKRRCAHRCKTFFACGSSAPVRVEHEDSAAAWLAGTLAVPTVQEHGLPLLQELWPYQSLFLSLCSWGSMAQTPLWPIFLCSSAHSGTYRAPLPAVLLCCSAC